MTTRMRLDTLPLWALALLLASPLAGQERREIPGCAAAVCMEGTALVTALDTAFRAGSACDGGAPFVLRTMYLAPLASFARPGEERNPAHTGLPSSPPVALIDDVDHAAGSFRRYWSEIRIVSPAQVERGAVPDNACLFVFAPVTWLGLDQVRVQVVVSRNRPGYMVQRFVFLERRRGEWAVTRVEYGVQS